MAIGKAGKYENGKKDQLFFFYIKHKLKTCLQLYTSEGESVEWLNFMIEKIWRSVDPDFFTVIEDLLEDTIQSVAPSFIVRAFFKIDT